jgi:hypothetical protein
MRGLSSSFRAGLLSAAVLATVAPAHAQDSWNPFREKDELAVRKKVPTQSLPPALPPMDGPLNGQVNGQVNGQAPRFSEVPPVASIQNSPHGGYGTAYPGQPATGVPYATPSGPRTPSVGAAPAAVERSELPPIGDAPAAPAGAPANLAFSPVSSQAFSQTFRATSGAASTSRRSSNWLRGPTCRHARQRCMGSGLRS